MKSKNLSATMDGIMSRVCMTLILTVSIYALTAKAEFNETKYWIERSALMEEDQSLAFGGGIPFASDDEKRANDLLMAQKRSEIDQAFFNASTFPPAKNFVTVIKDIEQSNVFKMIKKMPKGTVSLVHSSAFVSAEWVYENLTYRDNVYICIRTEKLLLRIFNVPTNDCNWQLLSELRKNETVAKDINLRIQKQLTLVTENPAEAYPDSDSMWKKFKKILDIRVPLLRYKPVFEDYLYQGLKELYEDNVMFVEIRTPLLEMYDLEGTKYNEDSVMEVYTNVTNRFINDHPDFIGLKVILAMYRKLAPKQMENLVRKVPGLKEKYPNLLAGIDLIAQEDLGYPLKSWVHTLKPLVNKIDFYLHAGETNWNGLESDENLFDAVLLNSKRISHGFAMTKHPKILELVKSKKISIVVCPIANQVLGLVGDLRNHPATLFFSQNFPVVVSNDDPGAWGANALSYDFYEAFMGLMSKHADIRALKQLAINSIDYSSMNDQEKARARDIWQQKWNKFVRDLITEANV